MFRSLFRKHFKAFFWSSSSFADNLALCLAPFGLPGVVVLQASSFLPKESFDLGPNLAVDFTSSASGF